MDHFENEIAFITGGASGAGFGQAQVFGRAGCRIVIADIRPQPVEEALAQLRADGITAHGIVLDIMDRVAYARAAGVEHNVVNAGTVPLSFVETELKHLIG